MIRSTFAVPVLIALATLAGLIIALLGDDWHDAAGWAGLSSSLLAIAWAVRPKTLTRKDRP